MQKKARKKRIDIIDALRGCAIIYMVYHHLVYDLVVFADAPSRLVDNAVIDILQPIFASVFIVLCGVSSNFSKSNLKRGAITLAVAMVITLVTTIMDMPIVFGVLHLLSVCMLLYGCTRKLFEKINGILLLVICIALAVISRYCVNNIDVQSGNLWILGWQGDFVSYDYFPLFPWVFVFLSGTAVGRYIAGGSFPEWFYNAKIPVLPAIGRHSLIIYIAHQPVLYALTLIISLFK